MCEVWLAEDTRLGRNVALKLLPAAFTEDSERVRRFTQEAKAASAGHGLLGEFTLTSLISVEKRM